MSLPQRQAEILEVLAEHPMGLSTAQITRDASSKPGSELPKDTGVVSNLIYTMRAAGLVTTHDQIGASPRLHKLTEKGIEAISENHAFAMRANALINRANNSADSDLNSMESAQ